MMRSTLRSKIHKDVKRQRHFLKNLALMTESEFLRSWSIVVIRYKRNQGRVYSSRFMRRVFKFQGNAHTGHLAELSLLISFNEALIKRKKSQESLTAFKFEKV